MEHIPHIAILPSPGLGHLIPLVELAKQLVHFHGFSITFVIPTSGAPSEALKAVLKTLPEGVNLVFLPPVTLEERFEGIEAATEIALTMIHSLSSFRDAFKSLITDTWLVALIVDFFGTDAFDIAKEFHVSSYMFFPSPAMGLSWSLYLPKLDEMVSCEYRDLTEPVKIPGCIPVHGRELMDMVDRKSNTYKWLLHHNKRFTLAEGIIVNSFMDLEPGAIKALQREEPGKPPVYAIGPIVRASSSSGFGRSECLQWLDNQPSGSVLFISFGSGGTLSYDQLNELALGLEMSGQRFLWVVKSPNNRYSNATFFSVQSEDDPFGFLPKGFSDRTKGRALLVPSWAPQFEVLSHGSTGGFVTHCGWNSILESVVNGIPLIAWPLFGDQKMNSVMLTEDLKVALRPTMSQNGLVGREEIAKLVKALMEGDEGKTLCNRMLGLKEAALEALSKDGSSTKSLSELALKWKNVRCV